MHGVVQVGHGFVGTVYGQRVLDQVVGADGQEVEVLQEQLERERGGWNFYHGADLDLTVGGAALVQLDARLVDQRQRLTDFAGMGQHGNQQIHGAMGGSAQDGAQLGQEHFRIGQAPADGAQAQGRVQVGLVLGRLVAARVQRLVGADVNGTYGDGQAMHAVDGAAVGLVLFFFIGQFALAAHEQEFAAEQADANGTRAHGDQGVLGHFDVGQQLDLLAVQRDAGRMAKAVQAAAFELNLALLVAVFGQDDRRRVDDDQAGVAVDHDPVVLPHQLAGAARADHGRNVHAARNDGRVRGLATDVGDEAGKHAALELQHVGR